MHSMYIMLLVVLEAKQFKLLSNYCLYLKKEERKKERKKKEFAKSPVHI